MKRFTLPLVFLILSSCRFPSLERDPLEFLAFLRFFSSSQFTGHSIGGAVSGLSTGASVTLTNNQDSVTVTSDGNFTFPKKLSSGQSYNVSLVTNGSGLSCTITNAQGVVQSSNVNNINVTCGWGTNFYEVGVNVSGLSGTISVQNNAETLNIATTGLTKFTTLISTGSNYAVTITSQPLGTVCSFDDPTLTVGTMAAANVTLFITCITGYIVGGNIHPTPSADLGTNLIGRQTLINTKVGSFPVNAGGAGAVTGGAAASASPTIARFSGPNMITTDGNFIYLADSINAVIRKIDKSNGTTTILAGGNSGGGTVCPGTVTTNCKDGVGTAAEFNGITGLTTDGNNLFVLESSGRRIRKVNLSTSVVSTFAGTGNAASADNVSGILASFNNPSWITMYNSNLYVVDRGNCTIRVINPTTTAVSTIAGVPTICSFADNPTGTNARFLSPIGAVGLGGYLYITDLGGGGGHKIRRLSLSGTNAVDTIAGDGVQASTDGIGTAAQFNDPHGVTTDGTNLFISEWSGHRIRHLNIATGKVTTLVGSVSGYADNTGGNGLLNFPGYLISDGLNIYISDTGNHSLRYLEPSELLRYTFDGNTNDSIGTNHGLITGAPTPTADENALPNGAYEFHGSGEIIQSTTNITPAITGNLTISAWVYPAGTDSAATQFIFYRGLGGSNGYGLAFESVGTSRRLYVSLGAVGPSGFTTMRLPLNQWSHVVLRRSNPNWQIYINGKPDSIVFTTNPIAPANTFKVGDAGNGNYFKGKISDVRFFNGALDNDSIQKLAIQVPSGLISYFPFNGNAKDYGNFHNDLNITGAAITTDRNGHPNGAYYFNGASFMQKLNPNGLPTGSSARTICAWFNKSSSIGEYIVGFGTFVNLQGNGLVVSDTVTGMFGVADDVTTFHEGFRNQWMHLCGTYDSANVRVYENGVLRAFGSKAWSTVPGPSLEIGRRLDGVGNFSGDLDDIRIYNRVLSDTEIRVLSGHYPTQVSSWNPSIAGSRLKFFLMPEAASFGPGACSGGTNCIGVWDDRSGNGYHVSQASAASQPNYNLTGINGSPGVRFLDGPATYLSRACTPDLNSTSNTIFVVFNEANSTSNDGIFHNGTKLLYLPDNAGNLLSLFDIQLNTARLVSTANYNTANVPVLMSLDFDGSLGNIYKGGAVVGSNSTTGGTYNCSAGDLSIGRFLWDTGTYPTNGDYFDGLLGDMIYFDQVLSTSDRETVECYLSNKYNLPVGHSCP
ncbi:concanavalin A-like lectin/glucanases family protein [Leptospira wolbachii serovar Codice str. CDC]|uniref:Concanavalin A-like lectin/glucanases family protein n=1 Tax=Leptospira wolbachii serovar Codice str. CDC TaxID=1218599 RepID=R9ABS9_9LEPT|nr:LamG-like jellyroll fold domain-containing protein [Leptospira wolbachii]EOQ97645.1 concanavalin A-like lectin/glucanases family protein [Leptospira wolbachii serovar Codice str. CDC]